MKILFFKLNLINKLFFFIRKYYLIVLGLIIILFLIIWFRYIHIHLLHEVPFEYISFYGLIILITIRIIYSMILISLIKPNFKQQTFINKHKDKY